MGQEEQDKDESIYLTVPQVAKIFGVSRIAIYKQVKSGKIKAVRFGRNYAIPRRTITDPTDRTLSEADKKQLEAAVKRTIKEYGWVLKKLGNE